MGLVLLAVAEVLALKGCGGAGQSAAPAGQRGVAAAEPAPPASREAIVA